MQFISNVSPETIFGKEFKSRKVRIDSKGRISIPSEIRKNFNMGKESDISLVFNLKENCLILVPENFGEGIRHCETGG